MPNIKEMHTNFKRMALNKVRAMCMHQKIWPYSYILKIILEIKPII